MLGECRAINSRKTVRSMEKSHPGISSHLARQRRGRQNKAEKATVPHLTGKGWTKATTKAQYVEWCLR